MTPKEMPGEQRDIANALAQGGMPIVTTFTR